MGAVPRIRSIVKSLSRTNGNLRISSGNMLGNLRTTGISSTTCGCLSSMINVLYPSHPNLISRFAFIAEITCWEILPGTFKLDVCAFLTQLNVIILWKQSIFAWYHTSQSISRITSKLCMSSSIKSAGISCSPIFFCTWDSFYDTRLVRLPG